MARDSIELQRQDFEKRQALVQVNRGTKKRGELAEMAFIYKAASLGFGVARPYGDSDRYDFIVHSGEHFWRVQVKSSSAMQYGGYMVNAQRCANGRSIPYTAMRLTSWWPTSCRKTGGL